MATYSSVGPGSKGSATFDYIERCLCSGVELSAPTKYTLRDPKDLPVFDLYSQDPVGRWEATLTG
jgi:hypothetical protein